MNANQNFICDKCGAEFWIDSAGLSHHWGRNLDKIDHDLDADHCPFSLENN